VPHSAPLQVVDEKGLPDMIDVFDIFAFVVLAVLLATAVVIVVFLGSLPGKIAAQRGHPQAAAVNVASWLGVATLGFLWPVALIWAFLKTPTVLKPAESASVWAQSPKEFRP
jgi:uncharacterized BrkB/YihY/UPF0761 family membrane protein